MSRIFRIAKKNYDRRLWTKADLQKLVDNPDVEFTQEDYDAIVGTDSGENESL